MKIIFFGSTEHAVLILRRLHQLHHEVVLAVTSPPRKKGRGLKLQYSPVHSFCQEKNMECIAPEDPNDSAVVKTLALKNPDIFLVVEYGRIFHQEVLDIPRIMPLNIHPSVLPLYRGPTPVNWQILNGEKTSGVTFHKVVRKIDKGPFVFQKTLDISGEDDAVTLHDKLINLAREHLEEVLSQIEKGTFKFYTQDESKATYFTRLTKEKGKIDWNLSSDIIERNVKGFIPWPTAYSYFRGKLIKFYRVHPVGDTGGEPNLKPGQIGTITDESFSVRCGKGRLQVLQLQPQDKRIMTAREFICGYNIKPGDSFE